MQRLQPYSMTDGIRNGTTGTTQTTDLADSMNICIYRFRLIHRLQPNFTTDGIRNFMYTKYKEDSAKLRIFSVTAATTYATIL